MDTEVVVNQTLSEKMISAGTELTRLLDEAAFPFSASLWFLTPESTWRFVIASPELTSRGPRWAYRHIQSVLSKIPNAESRIALKDITVLDSNNLLIKLLRSAINTGTGIHNIRFAGNVINGIPIEDAYIYRLT